MLFRQEFWPGLADGSISLAFRRWQRPAVRTGTQFRSPVGLIEVQAVEVIDPAQISEIEAHQAGYPSLEHLLVELNSYQGRLYRIALRYAGSDPRIALRQADQLTEEEFAHLHQRLRRYEGRFTWTSQTLRLIGTQEGLRAGDLAPRIPMPLRAFKRRVRQLKDLGLTESLGVGYRISPRGRAYLDWLAGQDN